MAKEILDKEDMEGGASESLENIIYDEADPDIPIADATGTAARPMRKNFIDKAKELYAKEKGSLIQIGILLLAVIILSIASASINGSLKESAAMLDKEYNKLNNDIDTFKKTDPYYTRVDNSELTEHGKDVNWIPVHGKADGGRVTADRQKFWDLVGPIFDSYGTAHPDDRNSTGGRGWINGNTGYPDEAMFNERVTAFAKEANLGWDNMFLASFVSYSEVMYTDKSIYESYFRLIGSTAKGDYHYFAMIPMKASARAQDPYTMIGFTFTAEHDAGGGIKIRDFNVWPPRI